MSIPHSKSSMDATAIDIQSLVVRFRRTIALNGIDATIRRGRVFALLGENGAGKTTLIRVLTGFQKPNAGECRVLGMNPRKDRRRLRQAISYVSDQPPLYDWMRIDEIGTFVAAFHPAGFIDRYQRSVAKYELDPGQKIASLSKGQRAKVALSLALANDPELLILDEPTSGLDPVVRRDFLESMIDRADAGRTVFLSSHQVHEVERVADDVAILHRGKIRLVGAIDEVKQSVTEVIVRVDDPLVALPPPSEATEVWSEQTSGRVRRMVLHRGDANEARALAKRDGVLDVQVRTLGLEELFVAATRGLPELSDDPSFTPPSRRRHDAALPSTDPMRSSTDSGPVAETTGVES